MQIRFSCEVCRGTFVDAAAEQPDTDSADRYHREVQSVVGGVVFLMRFISAAAATRIWKKEENHRKDPRAVRELPYRHSTYLYNTTTTTHWSSTH